MEEKRIKLYDSQKTFFNKITRSLTKMLIPSKIGFNSLMIKMKRNNLLKAYKAFLSADEIENVEKKDIIIKKYESMFALYLESIDKYIMDSMYSKVKKGIATDFEKDALSKYYVVVHLKETEYLEYKYKKQQYLLELDYFNVGMLRSEKVKNEYKVFYTFKMDSLYKKVLKHYSVLLADASNKNKERKQEIYTKIFNSLEQYISEILPLKLENEENKKIYKDILEEYNEVERFNVGKLSKVDSLEKNMLLLGISRKLFTHSLPLIAAEQCYIKLLKDARTMIVNEKSIHLRVAAYELFIEMIDNYNVKLLSNKVYWQDPKLREEYKVFWDEYKELDKKDKEYQKNKEILFLKNDLKQLERCKDPKKHIDVIKFEKSKLVEYGIMKELKNKCRTDKNMIKKLNNEKSEKIKK